MRADRVLLLMVMGAISALVGAAVYLAIFFFRHAVPFPCLSPPVWALVIGVPCGVGAIIGLIFPTWQRMVDISHPAMRSISLWALTAVITSLTDLVVFGLKALKNIVTTDFLFWLICGVIAGLCFHGLRVLTGDTDQPEAKAIGKLRHSIGFKTRRSMKVRGVALMLDIQEFAAFFNQPWAAASVPRYLDLVFQAVTIELFGGKRFWGDGARIKSFLHPVHQKFIGDGLLFVWTPPGGKDRFNDEFRAELVRRVVSFRREFPLINAACVGPIPSSFKLPDQLRFGISAGEVFELKRKWSYDREYIGFCINLASRLQGYCRELGLIVSSRHRLPDSVINELDLIKVRATRIKGFRDEEVFVARESYEQLDEERKKSLFDDL